MGYITPLEKLAERRESLKTEKVSPNLESLRLQFLQPLPKQEGTHQDRQIQSLERELQELLALVA